LILSASDLPSGQAASKTGASGRAGRGAGGGGGSSSGGGGGGNSSGGGGGGGNSSPSRKEQEPYHYRLVLGQVAPASRPQEHLPQPHGLEVAAGFRG
jgi:hypothetical protein